jgi:hypothetical protein
MRMSDTEEEESAEVRLCCAHVRLRGAASTPPTHRDTALCHRHWPNPRSSTPQSSPLAYAHALLPAGLVADLLRGPSHLQDGEDFWGGAQVEFKIGGGDEATPSSPPPPQQQQQQQRQVVVPSGRRRPSW